MKKYKFKIGQKVEYTVLDSKEIKCECCGNVEEEFFDKKVEGTIISRSYEISYSLPSFATTDKVEIIDGKEIHKPYMSNLEIPVSEPYYKIQRGIYEDSVSEKSLIKTNI